MRFEWNEEKPNQNVNNNEHAVTKNIQQDANQYPAIKNKDVKINQT